MEENDCLICFEDLDSKDKAILSCNHVIHYSCLQDWIKRKKKITHLCPICNNDGEIINIIDAKPIYIDESLKCINVDYKNNFVYNTSSNPNPNPNPNIPKTNVVKNLLFGCCNIL